MLDSFVAEAVKEQVVRLAVASKDDLSFLKDQGLDDTGRQEMMALLGAGSGDRRDVRFLDMVFKRKNLWKTRFSDGSYPVFYCSLERRTAEAETKYWFKKRIVEDTDESRTAYYWRFVCDLDGTAVDLRPKQAEWPDLTHSTDYGLCNSLGKEAVNMGLDAFLTPSAREEGGTNVAVFLRRAVSNAERLAMFAFTYDAVSGKVTIREADRGSKQH